MKTPFGVWKPYEIVWLALFSAAAIVVAVMARNSVFHISVFLTGILCVFFAAKGYIWTYPLGLYNTACYGYLCYLNGLYGEMGLNLFFFVPVNVIGYFMWRGNMSGQVVRMREMGFKMLVLMCVACPMGIVAIGYLLSLIKGQNTPYIDATTNVLSIVAMFLMITRYKEQWILYIILNVFTIVMWMLRFEDGSQESPIMIVMWTAYLVNSFYGYYIWHKGALQTRTVGYRMRS